jgi:hypothetical protein
MASFPGILALSRARISLFAGLVPSRASVVNAREKGAKNGAKEVKAGVKPAFSFRSRLPDSRRAEVSFLERLFRMHQKRAKPADQE